MKVESNQPTQNIESYVYKAWAIQPRKALLTTVVKSREMVNRSNSKLVASLGYKSIKKFNAATLNNKASREGKYEP